MRTIFNLRLLSKAVLNVNIVLQFIGKSFVKESNMNDLKTQKKNMIFFPLGTVGRDMIYNLFNNFILTYILFTRNLTTAQLAAITAIIVASRVFDALNDPIMGNIIERTRTKWGKFKPWLLIGILSTSLVVYAAFNVQLQGWSFIIFFGVIYFLYSITYTMHDISYWGMITALGSDGDARNQFTSRATLFAGIGGALAGFLIPRFTTGAGTLGGNAAFAYGKIALVICILAPLFMCFTLFGVKEDRSYMSTPAPKVSFKKIIGTITGNPQLMWMALIFLFQQLGNSLVGAGLGSTYIYLTLGYDGGYYSNFSTFGLAASAVLMVVYPAISRKIKRKPLMGIMAIVAAVGFAIMFITGNINMSDANLKCWILTVGYMFANFGMYSYYLIMMISILNTVEYNEYLHGERDEAIITSLRPFLTKMASAILALLTSVCYKVFGVLDYTNAISDFERQAATGAITEQEKLTQIGNALNGVAVFQKTGLLVCITVLPLVFTLISYFLYKKHYSLDEDEYDRICKELAARK